LMTTAHNDYSPRRALVNLATSTVPDRSRCCVAPPPHDCRNEKAGGIDCHDYVFGNPKFWSQSQCPLRPD
jgi:hypothetical protein